MFPFFLAAAAVLALAAGSRTGFRTSAQMAEDEEAGRKAQEEFLKNNPKLATTPAVQGTPSYWFFWWIWVDGKRVGYGPVWLSDAQAWAYENQTRSTYLGATFQRWVWTGRRWLLDERKDTAFLASAPIPGYSVGAVPVVPPIRGKWTNPGFPETVKLDGRTFRKATWQMSRPGVIAQYREDIPASSRHLFVLSDRTFVIDHLDEANPDKGREFEHLISDVLLRPVGLG